MSAVTGNDEIDQAIRDVQMDIFKKCNFQDVILVVAQRHIDEGDWDSFEMQRMLVAEHRPDDLAEFDRVFIDHIC